MKKKKRKIWVTADPHFNHDAIIGYCNRPFKDSLEMNECIKIRFNNLVQDQDIVYVLGDVGRNLKEIVPTLNGIKILIRGNHDNESTGAYLNMGFSAVLEEAAVTVGKKRVYLRHVPARTNWDFLKLCGIWIRKMRKRKIPWKIVWQRLKRERKYHRAPSESIVICGHVHNAWKTKHNNINVGVDVTDFKPVELYSVVNRGSV